jgi:hypothetical protein
VLRLWQAGKLNVPSPICRLTLSKGHISRDCTSPNGGPLNAAGGKTCYRCGEVGHISRDCAQVEVNGEGAPVPVDAGVPVAPTTAVA